jgi:hypothetical protein
VRIDETGAWGEPWLHFQTTWAVCPDVIDGSELDNDALLADWLRTRLPRGAPVWHLHESLDRLRRLADTFPRICFGSSGQYSKPGSDAWSRRVDEAWNAIHSVGVWVHMLRAMDEATQGPWPFASADSTNLARNHLGSGSAPGRDIRRMAERIDSRQTPARWTPVARTEPLAL